MAAGRAMAADHVPGKGTGLRPLANRFGLAPGRTSPTRHARYKSVLGADAFRGWQDSCHRSSTNHAQSGAAFRGGDSGEFSRRTFDASRGGGRDRLDGRWEATGFRRAESVADEPGWRTADYIGQRSQRVAGRRGALWRSLPGSLLGFSWRHERDRAMAGE